MSEYLNEMIGYQVQGTAEWRRRKAEEFPDDTRNQAAAEQLDRLASEIDALSGSPVEKQITDVHDSLREHSPDVWQEIDETVSEELRSIGFHNGHSTALELLEWYRDLLQEKLHELIDNAVPPVDLAKQVEADPSVKAAKRAYDDAYAKAMADARKTL